MGFGWFVVCGEWVVWCLWGMGGLVFVGYGWSESLEYLSDFCLLGIGGLVFIFL